MKRAERTGSKTEQRSPARAPVLARALAAGALALLLAPAAHAAGELVLIPEWSKLIL